MAKIVILFGLLIFLSHLFYSLFSRTKIPNPLLLLLTGIIIGPLTGWVDKSVIGEFGKIFSMLTLIIILFEGGINLKFKDIGKALFPSSMLTIWNFLTTFFIAGIIVRLLAQVDWLSAFFIASVIGGTSSAVVIPILKQMKKMESKAKTILTLETIISDVLCLVVGIAIFEGMRMGNIDVDKLFLKLGTSFSFAIIFGIAMGLLWALIMKLFQEMKNGMFTHFAFVFIIYGLAEMMHINGGISVLSFALVLGNSQIFNESKRVKSIIKADIHALNEHERKFFSEIVFIVQTYFFVYVGLSIKFGNIWTLLIGLIITAAIILVRPFAINVFVKKKVEAYDIPAMSVLTPKGLITAVLASLPFQYGLPGGETIMEIGYAIVLFSILICSILLSLVSKNPDLLKRRPFSFKKPQA